MDKISEKFFSQALKFGISLSEKQLENFQKYYDSLKAYNSHTNIVSNDEKEEVYIKHFLDSLAFGLVEKDKNKSFSMLDIGCGGGFPGVPILLAYENASLTSVDSVGKKIRFVEELVSVLNLENRLFPKNIRVEDLSFNNREYFDYAFARAVAPLSMLIEYCIPYLKVGGCLAAYKSKTAKEEITAAKNALNLLKSEVIEVVDYKLEDEYTRNIVLIRKNETNDIKYPRKNGFVKKYPI